MQRRYIVMKYKKTMPQKNGSNTLESGIWLREQTNMNKHKEKTEYNDEKR